MGKISCPPKYLTWYVDFCQAGLVAGLNLSPELASWAQWAANNPSIQSRLQNATAGEAVGWTDGVSYQSS